MNREEIRTILDEKSASGKLNIYENTNQFKVSTIRPDLEVSLIIPIDVNELFFEARTLDDRFTLKDYGWFEDEDFRDYFIFFIDILENHELRLGIMNHHKEIEYLDGDNEWENLFGMDIELAQRVGQSSHKYLKWFAILLSIMVVYIYLSLI